MSFEPGPHSEVRGTDLPRECAQQLKPTQSHTLVSTEADTCIESLLEPTEFSTLSKLGGGGFNPPSTLWKSANRLKPCG